MMKTILDLPADCPFAFAIEDEVELTRVFHLEVEEDPADVDFHFAEPLEHDLVNEALRAHDIYETWKALTGA